MVGELKSCNALTVKVEVTQPCPNLCDPIDYTVHGILQARILEWVGFPFSPGDLPNPGVKPRSPALRVDSLPAKPQGKPKNTGVGSRSLRQRIFLTQESNHGPLHCRQILYQLSYQGSNDLRHGQKTCFKKCVGKRKSVLNMCLYLLSIPFFLESLIVQLVKNLPAMQETPIFDIWARKIRWRRDRLPTPVFLGFPGGSAGKESARDAGDLGLIPGLGRSPGEGKGYPLQYSGSRISWTIQFMVLQRVGYD